MSMQPLKVHIIDDDMDDVFLIKKILHDRSHEPFEVSNSGAISEAIKALKASPAHVILLDLSLPDASGFEGLIELQRQIPSSNIIILTGMKDEDSALDALKQGASDYLTKDELNPTLLTRTILYSHERQKLEEQLRQSRKIEAVGQLAGGIAHDFNNQIGIMRLLVDQLETFAENQADLKRIANDLTSIIEKCSNMTKQILGFSRKQALFPAPLSLNSLLKQMAPFASRLVGADVSFKVELDPLAGDVHIDKNQLEQVLWNLILNAKHALADKREIIIKTGAVSPDQVQGCMEKVDCTGTLSYIEIIDSGQGMEPEILERIFDPFFTTKPQGEGTGLGLSTAMGFIRQSGGYIAVTSKPGQGSRFQILLPQLSGSSRATGQDRSDDPDEAVITHAGVLVCDDEAMLRELISSSLEERGFEVFQAKDGQEGFEVFNSNKSRIRLIITDLTMPRVSGCDLVKMAQAVSPDVKSIIMTGFSKPELSDDLNRQNLAILSKPFSMNDLIKVAVNHILQ